MERKQDDFKWFGEGFDGFPRRLPDDAIEYSIYDLSSQTNKLGSKRTEEIQSAAEALSKKYFDGYVWHKESFNLQRSDMPNDEAPGKIVHKYLRGQTSYGDSIEDEWLIVFLLRELSRQFTDLWIKMNDSDGEFLLVEAANMLPRWIRPEIAENRVRFNTRYG
jgi:hypothetical protein